MMNLVLSMNLVLALLVGILLACAAYLLLRRDAVKLVLGLSLLSYGVNFVLFGTGRLGRGLPPIIPDKESFEGNVAPFVDPLPQALILTAIVISFGVTAFVVVLLNQRNALVEEHETEEDGLTIAAVNDPFSQEGYYLTGLDSDPDDYEWLESPIDSHPDVIDETIEPDSVSGTERQG
jgi:multicomponent Na+:H+ antiporter subunit C